LNLFQRIRLIVGEMASKLRSAVSSLTGISWGRWSAPYALRTSRVDYNLARALYWNTDDDYKLGAAFARPVINTTLGFMGVPVFSTEDDAAQEVLDEFHARNVARMQRTLRDALRDGDCFVRLSREEVMDRALYPELPERIEYSIIPPAQLADIQTDHAGRPQEYVFKSQHRWGDRKNRRYTITERLSRERIVIEADGEVPPDFEPVDQANPWGFIPVVHFRNEAEEDELFGRSDLEPIEPFMRAYHDVLLQAMQGHKLHSTPRLKLKLADVGAFIRNNFGKEPEDIISSGETVNLEGHELLFFQDEEDAEFIEVRSNCCSSRTRRMRSLSRSGPQLAPRSPF